MDCQWLIISFASKYKHLSGFVCLVWVDAFIETNKCFFFYRNTTNIMLWTTFSFVLKRVNWHYRGSGKHDHLQKRITDSGCCFPHNRKDNVCLLRGRSPDGIPAFYLCYMHIGERQLAPILAHQEVSRYHTRGESEASLVHRQGSMQVRDPPWLWNRGQMSPEVQNRGTQWPPQKGLLSSKIFFLKTTFV